MQDKKCLEECYKNNYGCPICKAGSKVLETSVELNKYICYFMCILYLICSPIICCFIILGMNYNLNTLPVVINGTNLNDQCTSTNETKIDINNNHYIIDVI